MYDVLETNTNLNVKIIADVVIAAAAATAALYIILYVSNIRKRVVLLCIVLLILWLLKTWMYIIKIIGYSITNNIVN